MKTICVYCSSSNRVPGPYMDAARELAAAIVREGYGLVYGGADAGIMGLIAMEVHRLGGHVTGVIPQKLADKGLAWDGADECVVTTDMRERKRVMEERADAFIALPGGFGTLEELFEIITLKQLQYHNKAIVLLNACGFYDSLLELCARIFKENFAKPEFEARYHIAPDADDAFAYVSAYVPPVPIEKWGETRTV
jgi:uncharacterized protein (TIGR00730 family)